MEQIIGLGAALAPFFDREVTTSPSHDELDNAFKRAGVTAGDPRRLNAVIGKAKRVRLVFQHAADHDPDAGILLAKHLVELCRAKNAFMTGSDGWPGVDKINALRRAFRTLGYELDQTGGVHPLILDNLEGSELTDALWSIVRRANANPDDASLQVGNGKDLDEAAARHVLTQKVGPDSYAHNWPFRHTLAQAFIQVGFSVPSQEAHKALDKDPHKAVEQSIYLLACAANRLRNEVGTGHGRPSTPQLSPAEGRLAARAAALVSGMLLDGLD